MIVINNIVLPISRSLRQAVIRKFAYTIMEDDK